LKKEAKDKHNITITDLLKSHKEGLTISEIMQKTGLARHTVLARLHKMVGEGNVGVRQINMAKLHKWKGEEEIKQEDGKNQPKLVELKEEHITKVAPKPAAPKPLTSKPIAPATISKPEPKSSKQELISKTGTSSKPAEETKPASSRPKIDMAQIKRDIMQEMASGKLKRHEGQLKQQREPILQTLKGAKERLRGSGKEFIMTGIEGFDQLLIKGIPKGYAMLLAGGAGSGKTIFAMQTLIHHANQGKKCFFMSFEESEEHLTNHMKDFGWNPDEMIKKGNLMLKRFNPFDITRSVEAMLAKQKGELLIDLDPIILPENFKPDLIVVDSLTAIASAFTGKEESYRIYIEQLFRFFEKIGATSFLITETKQIPEVFSTTGVEEFLADGVIVLYSIKRGNVRENAIEILKLRGAKHQKKIVAMQITDDGVVIYPEQEVFGEIGGI